MVHPLNSQMTAAAQIGNLAEMKRLREHGAEVSFADVNDPLIQCACKGNSICIEWLLDQGANIDRSDNSGRWTPLMLTAYYGHAEATRLLLDRGANRELKNSRGQTALECARDRKNTDVIDVFENKVDEVAFSYPLNDRTMQEIFNFPRRERITLIRKPDSGAVEAMQRDSFSSLDDLTGLRKAFAEHKRRGGTLEEGDVFPNTLSKPKIPRKEI